MPDLNTVLFAPAPVQTSLTPIDRSVWSGIKSSMVKNAQIFKSALTGSVAFTDYHHVARRNVNRGDIAISAAIEQQILAEFPTASVRNVGWDDVPQKELYENFRQSSRVVIGGGGYIFLDASGNLNSRSLDLDIFERLDAEVIAHGIGLNRLLFENPWTDFKKLPEPTREWLRRFAERCKLISVRDEPTAQLFADGAGTQVDMVGDPALSLGAGRALEIARRSTSVVGINTASHGRRALFCLQRLMPELEKTYRQLAREGYQLKYFVHDDADYSVIRYLKLRGHVFDVVDGSPAELIEAYTTCSFVINQMLHSSILAFSVGVPCIGIAYDLKSTAFFDQYGLGSYCVQWNEVSSERLTELIRQVVAERDSSIQTIMDTAAKLVDRQRQFIRRALQ
jgi:polysaccharide pyruvyl transferase WcaK-like protein